MARSAGNFAFFCRKKVKIFARRTNIAERDGCGIQFQDFSGDRREIFQKWGGVTQKNAYNILVSGYQNTIFRGRDGMRNFA